MTARRLLVLLAAAGLACGPSDETPPAAFTSAPASRAASLEPEACRRCHASEVERFLSSSHRMAARRIEDVVQPPKAQFTADAPIDEMARKDGSIPARAEGAPPQLLLADAQGTSLPRSISHVMGGRRREDFLSTLSDGSHVLPLSWSITRSTWTSPLAEEVGENVSTSSPLWWTAPRRIHDSSCSRCHALPRDDAASGMSCSTCHGDASAHVAAKSGGKDAAPWATGMLRLDASNLQGCGTCHATGRLRPVAGNTRRDAPLTDIILPITLAGPGGLDVSFMIDGRPAVAHGFEVQALAQSACFLKGGATCTTCHDPHGGSAETSLREADPDASCRKCHAAIAADAAVHAKHPVATTPVPLALREPAGPPAASGSARRAPGCVDCHAPAHVIFGKGDMARDHAIGVPAPDAAAELGLPDACTTCHADRKRDALARDFAKLWPDRGESARLRRGRAFASAVGATRENPPDAAALRAVLEDASAGPWVQASAAQLLSQAGASPETTAALGRTLAEARDPVLAISAITSYAATGGDPQPLRDRMRVETDWRMKLAACAALAVREDPQGLQMLDAMHSDATLPGVARADAAVELSTVLIHRRSCKRAESLLIEALATDPMSVGAWLNIGVARACQNDAGGAREAFERVLQLSPGHVIAKLNLQQLEKSLAEPP